MHPYSYIIEHRSTDLIYSCRYRSPSLRWGNPTMLTVITLYFSADIALRSKDSVPIVDKDICSLFPLLFHRPTAVPEGAQLLSPPLYVYKI